MRNQLLTVGLTFFVSFCSQVAAGGGGSLGEWEWTETNGDAAWTRRAGLQVVDLDGCFYLMGGRTTRPPMFPPVPGDSDIWSDVWKSTDQGESWTEILATDGSHWPARAYFRALTKGEEMFVLGGQNFILIPNPDPACNPPVEGCPPFISISDFFNDVWSSTDGINWTERTPEAGWSPRAGLSSVVFNEEIYVIGGSFLDDSAVTGGPPERIYYNDVWKSPDGITWTEVAADPPFEPRAGAAVAVKDGHLYLFGGEEGFLCEPFPFCAPPYFNDVWRTSNGADWELVVETAAWPARPGHVVLVVEDQFVLFGGFGLGSDPTDPFAPGNPMDVWVSDDGAAWELVSTSPWNATGPEDIKYDFAALTAETTGAASSAAAIFTFGGDRETFDFSDLENYLNLDNDVWRFAAPASPPTCEGDFDGDGVVGVSDLIDLILSWGPCDECETDLTGNGFVGIIDLLILLFSWGPCEGA